MTLWFILAELSLALGSIDIRTMPEATVWKWAFVILVVFIGPIGAFIYRRSLVIFEFVTKIGVQVLFTGTNHPQS